MGLLWIGFTAISELILNPSATGIIPIIAFLGFVLGLYNTFTAWREKRPILHVQTLEWTENNDTVFWISNHGLPAVVLSSIGYIDPVSGKDMCLEPPIAFSLQRYLSPGQTYTIRIDIDKILKNIIDRDPSAFSARSTLFLFFKDGYGKTYRSINSVNVQNILFPNMAGLALAVLETIFINLRELIFKMTFTTPCLLPR
jgi:hypothetical protein